MSYTYNPTWQCDYCKVETEDPYGNRWIRMCIGRALNDDAVDVDEHEVDACTPDCAAELARSYAQEVKNGG